MQTAQAGGYPLPPNQSDPGISGRTLAALTAAVLLAHAVVLQNTPLVLDTPTPTVIRAFTTRTLQIEPPSPQPQTPAAVPVPTVPPPRRLAQSSASTAEPTSAPVVAPANTGPVPIAQPEAARYDLAAPLANTEIAPPISQAASAPPPVPTAAAANPALPKDAALEARAYAVPGSTRIKFDATGRSDKNNYQALGELLWLHDGKNYEARLELSIIFRARVLTSSGHLTADGLAPDTFSDKFRSKLAAHFERDKGRVSFSGNTPEAALLPGAQDQLSVFLQLASLIAGEPRKYTSGTTLSFQTVGPRAAEPWTFSVEAEEEQHLPGGTLDTLKLVRTPRREFDQKVEIWLAPALSYLPARIRITQTNGDFVDQQWRATAAP